MCSVYSAFSYWIFFLFQGHLIVGIVTVEVSNPGTGSAVEPVQSWQPPVPATDNNIFVAQI